jgi:hypothetical protein
MAAAAVFAMGMEADKLFLRAIHGVTLASALLILGIGIDCIFADRSAAMSESVHSVDLKKRTVATRRGMEGAAVGHSPRSRDGSPGGVSTTDDLIELALNTPLDQEDAAVQKLREKQRKALEEKQWAVSQEQAKVEQQKLKVCF